MLDRVSYTEDMNATKQNIEAKFLQRGSKLIPNAIIIEECSSESSGNSSIIQKIVNNPEENTGKTKSSTPAKIGAN